MCLPVANRDKQTLYDLLCRVKVANAMGQDGISGLSDAEHDLADRYLAKTGFFRVDFGRCSDSGSISWNSRKHSCNHIYLPFIEDMSSTPQGISVSQEPTDGEMVTMVETVMSAGDLTAPGVSA